MCEAMRLVDVMEGSEQVNLDVEILANMSGGFEKGMSQWVATK